MGKWGQRRNDFLARKCKSSRVTTLKRQIRRFHVVVVQWTSKKCAKKRDARAELLFWSLNLLFFWSRRCGRRRGCLSSLFSAVFSCLVHFARRTKKKKSLLVVYAFKTEKKTVSKATWVAKIESMSAWKASAPISLGVSCGTHIFEYNTVCLCFKFSTVTCCWVQVPVSPVSFNIHIKI